MFTPRRTYSAGSDLGSEIGESSKTAQKTKFDQRKPQSAPSPSTGPAFAPDDVVIESAEPEKETLKGEKKDRRQQNLKVRFEDAARNWTTEYPEWRRRYSTSRGTVDETIVQPLQKNAEPRIKGPRIFNTRPGFCKDIPTLQTFTPFYQGRDNGVPPLVGTLDMGDSGYTAVLSSDFDVIQLAAPSSSPDNCGLVFARGQFPDDSILSRGQRSGFGFGLKIGYTENYDWDDLRLDIQGRTKDDSSTGWLNYRWPIAREFFRLQSDDCDGETVEVISASYMKDGKLIQVSRIARAAGDNEGERAPVALPYKIGNYVRLGCSCTGGPLSNFEDVPVPTKTYAHEIEVSEDGYQLRVHDKDLDASFNVEYFCDGNPMKVSGRGDMIQKGGIDFGFVRSVSIGDDPVLIITSMSLQSGDAASVPRAGTAPTAEEIERELGLEENALDFGRVWKLENLGEKVYTGDAFGQLELDLIARTTEYILSVSIGPRIIRSDHHSAALISNIVSSMLVDVKTLFWQIRFLLDVYRFLEPLRQIVGVAPLVSAYRLRIEVVVISVVSWIYERIHEARESVVENHTANNTQTYLVTGKLASLGNGCRRGQSLLVHYQRCAELFKQEMLASTTGAMPNSPPQRRINRFLYFSLTLVYVIHFPLEDSGVNTSVTTGRALNEKLYRLCKQTGGSYETDSVTYAFLDFFNEIFRELTEGPNKTTNTSTSSAHGKMDIRSRWKKDWQMRRAELRGNDIYSSENEYNDRLCLLLLELPDYKGARNLGTDLLADVRANLETRTTTSELRQPDQVAQAFKSEFVNVRIKGPSRNSVDGSDWAPWELSCNSFLIELHFMCTEIDKSTGTNAYDIDSEDVKSTLQEIGGAFNYCCQTFLQHGYSMVHSLDETKSTTLSNWWSSETAVLMGSILVRKRQAVRKSKVYDSDSGRYMHPSHKEDSLEYASSFLSQELTGERLRVLLHETMLCPLSLRKQQDLLNLMYSVERSRILEKPSSDVELMSAAPDVDVVEVPWMGGILEQSGWIDTRPVSVSRLLSEHGHNSVSDQVQSLRFFITLKARVGLATETVDTRPLPGWEEYCDVEQGPPLNSVLELWRRDRCFPRLTKLLRKGCPAAFCPIDDPASREITRAGVLYWDGQILGVRYVRLHPITSKPEPRLPRRSRFQKGHRATSETRYDNLQETSPEDKHAYYGLAEDEDSPEPTAMIQRSPDFRRIDEPHIYNHDRYAAYPPPPPPPRHGRPPPTEPDVPFVLHISPPDDLEGVLIPIPRLYFPENQLRYRYFHNVDMLDFNFMHERWLQSMRTPETGAPSPVTDLAESGMDLEPDRDRRLTVEETERFGSTTYAEPPPFKEKLVTIDAELEEPWPSDDNYVLRLSDIRAQTFEIYRHGAGERKGNDAYWPFWDERYVHTFRGEQHSRAPPPSECSRPGSPVTETPPPSPQAGPIPAYDFHGVPTVDELLLNPGLLQTFRDVTHQQDKAGNNSSLPAEEDFSDEEYISRHKSYPDPPAPDYSYPPPPPRSDDNDMEPRQETTNHYNYWEKADTSYKQVPPPHPGYVYTPSVLRSSHAEPSRRSEKSTYGRSYSQSHGGRSYSRSRSQSANSRSHSYRVYSSEYGGAERQPSRSRPASTFYGSRYDLEEDSESGIFTSAATTLDDEPTPFFERPTIIHPHYMVTSLQDTPKIFDIPFEERMPPCDVENILKFYQTTIKHSNGKHAEFQVHRFPASYWFLDKAAGRILVADFSSMLNVTVFRPEDGWFELSKRLVDNRVDVDAKFRVIAVKSYTADLARLNLVLLHSECATAMNCYFGNTTRWYNHDQGLEARNGAQTFGPGWDTFLNIAFHEMTERPQEQDLEVHRTRAQYPPGAQGDSHKWLLTESCLCLSITGVTGGLSWTCSAMGTALFTHLNRHSNVTEIKQIMASFAYDAISSRCLVTQTLVGVIMEGVAVSYGKLTQTLVHSLRISDKGAAFDAIDSENVSGTTSVKSRGFQDIHTLNWAIKCLESFTENMADIRRCCDGAQADIDSMIQDRQHLMPWSAGLQQIHRDVVLAQCFRRRDKFIGVEKDILRRQQTIAAYRDSISNYLQLASAKRSQEQGETANMQGNNIRILTLITIVYLPLSLTTSIFGMDIMPDSASFVTLSWVLILTFILTVICVCYLESLIWAADHVTARIQTIADSTRTKIPSDNYHQDNFVGSSANFESTKSSSRKRRVPMEQTSSRGPVWTSSKIILRHFLVTLPANHAYTVLSWPASIGKSASSARAAKPPDPAQSSKKGTHKDPGFTNAGPRRDYDSSAGCVDRLNDHRKRCTTCERNPKSNVNEKLCGTGIALFSAIIDAQNGDSNLADCRIPSRPPALHTHSTSASNLEAFVRGIPIESDPEQKTQKTHTITSILKNGRIQNPTSARPWLKKLGRGRWMMGLISVGLAPVSLAVVAVEYTVILLALVVLSPFFDLGFVDDEGRSWWRWTSSLFSRPVAILYRDTSIA